MANLNEEIYISQPEGYIDPKNSEKVCKLLKAPYGLKQGSRSWNKTLEKLKELEFIQSKTDQCIYYMTSDELFLVAAIYVAIFLYSIMWKMKHNA